MPEHDTFIVVPVQLVSAPSGALKVYCCLRRFADRDNGSAWPSRATIAKLAAIDPNTVDRWLRWLHESGWITVRPRFTDRGAQTSNEYVVHGVPRRRPAPPTQESPPSPEMHQPPSPEMHQRTRTNELEPMNTSSPSPLVLAEPQPDPHIGALFDAWWELYPRKVGKGAARAAYGRAIRKAAPELIAAALRRAVAFWGPDLKFIPHPATWLNQERWADPTPELAPAPAPTRDEQVAGLLADPTFTAQYGG